MIIFCTNSYSQYNLMYHIYLVLPPLLPSSMGSVYCILECTLFNVFYLFRYGYNISRTITLYFYLYSIFLWSIAYQYHTYLVLAVRAWSFLLHFYLVYLLCICILYTSIPLRLSPLSTSACRIFWWWGSCDTCHLGGGSGCVTRLNINIVRVDPQVPRLSSPSRLM